MDIEDLPDELVPYVGTSSFITNIEDVIIEAKQLAAKHGISVADALAAMALLELE